MPEVPGDVLFWNILSRLPAKSLLRFTSVSKQWQAFLRTPAFVKTQLQHMINDDHQNHHKLILFSTTTPCVFHTIDCEAPQNRLSLTSVRSFPFKFRPEKMSIVASFHGMVCVAITKRYWVEYSDLILWNPLTGDHKTLSKPSFYKECLQKDTSPFALYYSSSEDDYRLLRVTHHPNVYIYSLKSDSWRKVELSEYFPRIPSWHSYSFHHSPSVLLDEKLYFLKQENTYRGLSSIISFNTKTEKLREIATPPVTNHTTDCLGFMVLKGCIHLYVAIKNSVGMYQWMELWMLNGDGDWVVTYRPMIGPLSSFDQISHIMRNGNWLMHGGAGCFYQLDVKKHSTDMIISSINSKDFCLGGKYMETMVSPNQYMKVQDQKARS